MASMKVIFKEVEYKTWQPHKIFWFNNDKWWTIVNLYELCMVTCYKVQFIGTW